MRNNIMAVLMALVVLAGSTAVVLADESSAKVITLDCEYADVLNFSVIWMDFNEKDPVTPGLSTYVYERGGVKEAQFLKFIDSHGKEGDIPDSDVGSKTCRVYSFVDNYAVYTNFTMYGLDEMQGIHLLSAGYCGHFNISETDPSEFRNVGNVDVTLRCPDGSSANVVAGGTKSILSVKSDEEYRTDVYVTPNVPAPSSVAEVKMLYCIPSEVLSFEADNVEVFDGYGGTGAQAVAYGMIGILVLFIIFKFVWGAQPRWSKKSL